MNRWAITLEFATGLRQTILVAGEGTLEWNVDSVVVNGTRIIFPGIEIVKVYLEGSKR